MARDFAKAFYNSKAWRSTSRLYMSSKNYICERCGAPGEICHHKTYLTPENISNPAIALDLSNLECLCRECHNEEHGTINHQMGVSFDENGNLVRDPDVYVVCGAPGSGKTFYVKTHKTSRDIVVDLDYICMAMACSDDLYFDHSPVLGVSLAVREYLCQRIEDRADRWHKAWIITAEPDRNIQKQLAFRLKGEVITMPTTKDECIKRIKNDERRRDKLTFYSLIDEWYIKNSDGK